MSKIRTAELVRVGNHYQAATPAGVEVRFGEAKDGGLSPMDTILVALAACTAMDVHSIATKKRQRIEHYRIHVRGEQLDDHPRVYTRIDVTHEVDGPQVSVVAIGRAIELSALKYCPVNAMLSAGPTEIHHRYLVRGTGLQPFEAEGEVVVTGPYQPPAVAVRER